MREVWKWVMLKEKKNLEDYRVKVYLLSQRPKSLRSGGKEEEGESKVTLTQGLLRGIQRLRSRKGDSRRQVWLRVGQLEG